MDNIKINSINARLENNQYIIENIIKNPLFGKMQSYRDNGYTDSFTGAHLIKGKDILKKEMFSIPHYATKLAVLSYAKDDTTLTSNGSKIIDLTPSELKDFVEVYKIADKALLKINIR